MTDHTSIDSNTIQHWITGSKTPNEIIAELNSKGYDEKAINDHILEFKKQSIARQQKKGFIFLAAGAIMGFISCILTLTNLFPGWFDFILYGLTTISIGLIMLGLYFVFED